MSIAPAQHRSAQRRSRRVVCAQTRATGLLLSASLFVSPMANGSCAVTLTQRTGLVIPSEARVSDRRFGGISGLDVDTATRQLVFLSDERVSPNEAVVYRTDTLGNALRPNALMPTRAESLHGISAELGIDLEALRIEARPAYRWIASEGGDDSAVGAWIGRFDSAWRLEARFRLPAPLDAAPHNRSIESLAFDEHNRPWIALENALPVDGPQGTRERGADLRIVRLSLVQDTPGGAVTMAAAKQQWVYRTEPAEAYDAGDSDIGISEMLRVGETWWVMERAGIPGDDGRYRFRSRLFCAEPDPASAVRLRKTLLLDSQETVDPLEANFEAMTLMKLPGEAPVLVIVNDNNFAPGVATRVLLWEISSVDEQRTRR